MKKLFARKDSQILFYLSLFFLLDTTVNLCINFYAQHIDDSRIIKRSFSEIIYLHIIEILSLFILSFVLIKFIRNQLNKSRKWIEIVFKSLLISIIYTFLRVNVYLTKDFLLNSEFSITFHLLIKNFIFTFGRNFILIISINFIILSFYYLNYNTKTKIQKLKLEKELTNTKLSILTGQLQPHFLFNSINSIVSLIDIDGLKAQNALIDLSNFYRDILSIGNKQKISLKRELKVLEKYISLMKMRFGETFCYEEQIDPTALKFLVPSLLFQPIVENAIKHGYSKHHNIVKVSLTIKIFKQSLQIEIKNSGKPIEDLKKIYEEGTGLKNLKSRLEHIYSSQHSMMIKNIENRGVVYLFNFPVRI